MHVAETGSVHPRQARFAAMLLSYALGTFNDNYFKQAVMLIAVAAGQTAIQGYAAAAFTLPFVLLAAPAGWAADRFSKRHVILWAKSTELAAAFVGMVALLSGHLGLMVGMVGLMGIQSTFFSPALNGAIPELHPADQVPQINAMLRMAVTFSILAGTALAGLVLGIQGPPLWGAPRGRVILGLTVIGMGILGIFVSLGIPRRPAADPSRPFPPAGPLETWKELRRAFQDRLLGTIILTNVFIWALGALQLLLINPLGLVQYHQSPQSTSFLVATQMIGIGLGGILAAHGARGEHWHRVLVPSGFLMTAFLAGLAMLPALPQGIQIPLLYVLLALVGASGGLILIPCESFIQIRPCAERKGATWAAANGAVFAGIVVASGCSNLLNAFLRPTTSFGVLALSSLAFTVWLHRRLRTVPSTRSA